MRLGPDRTCQSPCPTGHMKNWRVNAVGMTHPLNKGGWTPRGQASFDGSGSRISGLRELSLGTGITRPTPTIILG